MAEFVRFVEENRQFFEAMYAASSVVSILGWLLSFTILFIAWRRGNITRVTAFGVDVTMAQEAVVAATRASRERASAEPAQRARKLPVDIERIKAVVRRAFLPEVAEHLTGKGVLWVDDRPGRIAHEVTALKKFGLVVEQVTSTEAALAALRHEPFDLVISDMARGMDGRAGYELLGAIRASGSTVPVIIYTGATSPELDRQAKAKGAQGTADDPRELLSQVISILGA